MVPECSYIAYPTLGFLRIKSVTCAFHQFGKSWLSFLEVLLPLCPTPAPLLWSLMKCSKRPSLRLAGLPVPLPWISVCSAILTSSRSLLDSVFGSRILYFLPGGLEMPVRRCLYFNPTLKNFLTVSSFSFFFFFSSCPFCLF